MTKEEFTQRLFKVYYHIDKVESLLTGLPVIHHLNDAQLTIMLESQKSRGKQLRKQYDKVFGNISEKYGSDFDKLDELLEEHMNVKVTNNGN